MVKDIQREEWTTRSKRDENGSTWSDHYMELTWPNPPVSDLMNQQCRVCGEPAAGFHFGAFTCEGCKSFFGRTFNNQNSITECKNNGQCVINKNTRTSCKSCRLKKCLRVGMSKSGSRYGRRSNWFKIHCLLQEQQNFQGGHKWDQDEGNNNVVMGGHLWPERPPFVWPLPLLMPLQSIIPGPLPSSASTPIHQPPPPLPTTLQDPLTHLQSLGPVQDTPIDLSKSSVRKTSQIPHTEKKERTSRPKSPTPPQPRSPSQDQSTASKTPLDLTCVK